MCGSRFVFFGFVLNFCGMFHKFYICSYKFKRNQIKFKSNLFFYIISPIRAIHFTYVYLWLPSKKKQKT